MTFLKEKILLRLKVQAQIKHSTNSHLDPMQKLSTKSISREEPKSQSQQNKEPSFCFFLGGGSIQKLRVSTQLIKAR